jgi:DNA-binding SARP family transcriptional activator
LLGGFLLTFDDKVIETPLSAQRFVALVALLHHSATRAKVAGTLWPDSTEERAAANLRTMLWRQHEICQMIQVTRIRVSLAPSVTVDVDSLSAVAERARADPSAGAVDEIDLRILTADLLPEWGEEWVLAERERLRQLRLQALELLAERLISGGRLRQAVDAAFAAVLGEPLRESARSVLIEAYMAQGNINDALRQYREYRRLLREELGLEPSERLQQIMSMRVGAVAAG